MKTSGLSRSGLFACCVAIAACSQATELSHFQYAPNVSGAYARSESPAYSVLHNFGEGSDDGSYPYAGLIDVGDTLYGTTSAGGAYNDYGTIFSITTGGKEHVVYSFGSYSTDGIDPYAGLINVSDTFYGTTYRGGAFGRGSLPYRYGTVFSVTPSDADEKVLHSFGKGKDGMNPAAGLIDVSGTLYGTTFKGGAYGGGTAFRITANGTGEKVLHSFGEGSDDGSNPAAGLIDVNGMLYGTTAAGGTHGDGTVFSITTGGTEKVLHNFGGGAKDGTAPQAALVDVNGTIYGTTAGGGAYGGSSGYGTVFSITTGGKEKVLHSFGNGKDGRHPYAGLIDVNGALYGTTGYGGAYGGSLGQGTIFGITTGGTESVLHSFGNGTDGSFPDAGLVFLKATGLLYGTTSAGGTSTSCAGGCGTVFSITP